MQKNGLINLLALLAVGLAGFAVARYTNSLAGEVSVLFLGLGILVAAVSWFQMRLEENERLEKLEFDELAKSRGGSALFAAKDAESFPAQRSRDQFERFFVPIFTVLLCLIEAGGAYLLWRWMSKPATEVPLKEPLKALAMYSVFLIVLFILGKFSATFARLENHRFLRAGASYVLFNAFLCLAVVIGLGADYGGYPKVDLYIAQIFCGLSALLAVETLIGLTLEMYRPRVKGKVNRPLYDSRLVGLLGQPEGLITTAAQALDYQFGFQVSETWFYRLFFEKALKWLVLGQAVVLVLSTCFVVIDAGEQALLERCGKPVEGRTPLEPGFHAKLPWPIDKVYRFRTEQIQSFEVGVRPGVEKEPESVVLWTVTHTGKEQEDNFLVANREPASAASGLEAEKSKRTPPVSLLTGSIPVEFQITNLVAWVYNNEDAPSLLQDIATREVVRRFVSADMAEIMSHGRLEAGLELARRIQSAADEHHLGARIVSVGLQDMHPPVKVAPNYEQVVAAIHKKQAMILAAQAYDIRTNALAQADATNIVNHASANRTAREVGALAKAGLFTNQIPAFTAAPSVYVQRAYLDTFTRATANARKYLWLTTNTHDVLTFDLQDSIAKDLLSVNVPAPKK
jgi:regulator of protease activity HflC (stomatin/prohibitin superfamily)